MKGKIISTLSAAGGGGLEISVFSEKSIVK